MALFIHRRKVAERELAKKLAEEQPKVEPKNEEIIEEEKSGITKEDVASFPYFKLKSLAKEHGIDVKEKKADEIRAELIEKMGL